MVNPSRNRRKGFNAERELVKILRENGFPHIARVNVSGVSQPLPDVIGARKGVMYGFEVKSTNESKKTFYFREFDNIRAWLVELSEARVKSRGFLAVRFKGGVWRLYPIYPDVEKITVGTNKGISLERFIRNG